jgi:hypothetical protein
MCQKSSWTIFNDGSHLLAGRNVRQFRTSHKWESWDKDWGMTKVDILVYQDSVVD